MTSFSQRYSHLSILQLPDCLTEHGRGLRLGGQMFGRRRGVLSLLSLIYILCCHHRLNADDEYCMQNVLFNFSKDFSPNKRGSFKKIFTPMLFSWFQLIWIHDKLDKSYNQIDNELCLPWELNLLLSYFGLSALYWCICWNSWPSLPA